MHLDDGVNAFELHEVEEKQRKTEERAIAAQESPRTGACDRRAIHPHAPGGDLTAFPIDIFPAVSRFPLQIAWFRSLFPNG